MNEQELFSIDDLLSCWEHHAVYFVQVLNGGFDLEDAREDLRSRIGSEHDSRTEPDYYEDSPPAFED